MVINFIKKLFRRTLVNFNEKDSNAWVASVSKIYQFANFCKIFFTSRMTLTRVLNVKKITGR